jgi:hypothetical protein
MKDKTEIEVWVVKYWESRGLFKAKGHVVESHGRIYFKENGSYGMFAPVGKDVFIERKDAVLRVEELRKKKIVSIEKKLKKLRSMDFGEG